MINWFDMPAEGLSNGGQFEVKELEVTENGTYEEKGEMYNKVVVNVEGGGGLKTKEVNLYEEYADFKTFIDNLTSETLASVYVDITPIATNDFNLKAEGMKVSTTGNSTSVIFYTRDMNDDGQEWLTRIVFSRYYYTDDSRPVITIPEEWEIASVSIWM